MPDQHKKCGNKSDDIGYRDTDPDEMCIRDRRKHVESCKIVYFTKEELARVNKYSKVVASSLIETQSIGLRESIPIIIKQRKGFSVWQYGLIGGGICLVVGIVFYFWKKNKKNQV